MRVRRHGRRAVLTSHDLVLSTAKGEMFGASLQHIHGTCGMDGGSPASREEMGVQGSTRGRRYGRDEARQREQASGAYRGACWMRACCRTRRHVHHQSLQCGVVWQQVHDESQDHNDPDARESRSISSAIALPTQPAHDALVVLADRPCNKTASSSAQRGEMEAVMSVALH